jgi:ribonuclease VapC
MLVDASAIIAIIAMETDGGILATRLAGAGEVWISAITLYESVTGLVRQGKPVPDAQRMVARFIKEVAARVVPIDEALSKAAVDAYATYGKGRHKASLNMGDCFVYACAKALGAPLLFKGNDFVHTDIAAA